MEQEQPIEMMKIIPVKREHIFMHWFFFFLFFVDDGDNTVLLTRMLEIVVGS